MVKTHFLLFVSALALSVALGASPASAAPKTPLQDGATCFWSKQYMPAQPSCKQPFQCVVKKVLPASHDKLFQGVCVDSYNSNDYCIYQSVSYAVGTTSITANYACPNCTCSRLPGAAGASCECEPGPRCSVDVAGKPVGSACTGRQSLCVVNRVKKANNLGACTHPALSAGQCVSAGHGWGPIFYSSGVASGAIKAGDMCQRCACNKGQFSNCRRIKGCKSELPVPFSPHSAGLLNLTDDPSIRPLVSTTRFQPSHVLHWFPSHHINRPSQFP
ncbi:unnamed protein product [Closterium sp. NIES-54]